MTSPRSLTFALYTHWDIVENLVLLGRDFPALEPDQILSVISRLVPQKLRAECEESLRQMVSSELLQELPRGSALQIHPLVLEFVRGLTREHELGLSEVLKARVEAIKNATQKLTDALQKKESDLLRQSASLLAELFRQITQQLDQDRHAILELAERAKSRDSNLPIARRYAEVLSAYDGYIEPMAEMMDSGPSGTFYRYLETAEHALDHAVETLTIQGALYTQRQSMRQVAFQAKELRRLGREVLKQCSDTLLPLREEIRQHNTISTAISQLLGRIRKRGLTPTLKSGDLPIWRREMPRRVSVGNEVLTIMAEALNYQPAIVAFPDDDDADIDQLIVDRVDESALLQSFKKDLPIEDILLWLRNNCPTWSDSTLLRLYHVLIGQPEWQIAHADSARKTPLKSVFVTYYPHAVESLQPSESAGTP